MQRIALLAATALCTIAFGTGSAAATGVPATLTAPANGTVVREPALTVTYALAQAASDGVTITLTPASGSARTFPADGAAGAHTIALDLAANAIGDGAYRVQIGYRDPVDGMVLSPVATVIVDRSPTPVVTAARIAPGSFPASRPSRARLRLSEAMNVRFLLERRGARRWVKVSSSTRSAPAGEAFIRLPRGLRPGAHRLTIGATDTAGHAARPVRLSFRVR